MKEGIFEVHFWEQSPDAYQGKLPLPVTQCIQQLSKLHAENIEGVFRLNGSDSRVKELIKALDNGLINDWKQFNDVHTVATALKRYFRTMSTNEPIIPFILYDDFASSVKLPQQKGIEKIRECVEKLDMSRYNLLSYLMKYLNFIAKNQDNNKMTPKNIAVCFAPNIMVNGSSNSNSLSDSGVNVTVVEYMITHYDKIFTLRKITDELICDDEDIKAMSVPPLAWSHVEAMIKRNKIRMTYGTIPFVPAVTVALGIRRPTRRPPPFIEETDAVVGRDIEFGSNEPQGSAMRLKARALSVALPAGSVPLQDARNKSAPKLVIEESKKPSIAPGGRPRQAPKEEEVFVPTGNVVVRAGQRAGRRPPTRPKR